MIALFWPGYCVHSTSALLSVQVQWLPWTLWLASLLLITNQPARAIDACDDAASPPRRILWWLRLRIDAAACARPPPLHLHEQWRRPQRILTVKPHDLRAQPQRLSQSYVHGRRRAAVRAVPSTWHAPFQICRAYRPTGRVRCACGDICAVAGLPRFAPKSQVAAVAAGCGRHTVTLRLRPIDRSMVAFYRVVVSGLNVRRAIWPVTWRMELSKLWDRCKSCIVSQLMYHSVCPNDVAVKAKGRYIVDDFYGL